MASTSFWTQDRGNGLFPLFYNSVNFSRYPLTLYPEAVRFLLTFVVPYAFVAYHPVAGLLHKESALVGWLTLLIGALVFLLGLVVWQQGLARYEGIGS